MARAVSSTSRDNSEGNDTPREIMVCSIMGEPYGLRLIARLNDSLTILGGASAARWSAGMASARHAQHAVTVLVGVHADVTVTFDDGAVRGRIVGIPPDVQHVTSSAGPAISLLFDPERTGANGLLGQRRGLVDRRFAATAMHLGARAEPQRLRAMLDELTALTPPAPQIERRVRHALALWNVGPQVATVADVARAVGVSPAQFRALFKSAIGISPRRYRLWTLLLRGFADGQSSDATSLAHEAGFADLAHFSHTCRDFFGYAPSRLIGQRVVQVPAVNDAPLPR